MQHVRRLFHILLVVVLATFTAPNPALAHGVSSRADLPLPGWLFAWGAAAVLVVSFVALSSLWQNAKFANMRKRPLFNIPTWVRFCTGFVGIALFVLIVYSGFAGSQTPSANLTPQVVYVMFWAGFIPLSLLFGDLFPLFSPWRALGEAIQWVLKRTSWGTGTQALVYPKRLGLWPAVVGLAAFAWLELVYPDKGDPSQLAILALCYAAVQCTGMILYGVDTWLKHGDCFEAYFSLIARISPLSVTKTQTQLRLPLAGAAEKLKAPGSVALLTIAIGSTAFDGFSQSNLWANIIPKVNRFFGSIGFSQHDSLQLTFSVGLLMMVALAAAFYLIGVVGVRAIDQSSLQRAAMLFGHSLIPIAAAYFVAHYFSLLAYQGQAIVYLISDPLGNGANIFGTAKQSINYTWISAKTIWYIQTGALVLGHVGGLILAHDRALETYQSTRDAIRSQYWLLATMVAFTMLGLWLLAAANS